MERQGEEVHLTTNEARGGRTGTGVKTMLIVSLLLVIVALSAIWIFGAWRSAQGSQGAVVTNQAPPTPGP